MTFEKPIPFPPFDPNFPSRSSGTDSPTPSELRLRSASRPPGQPVEQVVSQQSIRPTTVLRSASGKQSANIQGLDHRLEKMAGKGGGLALKGLSLFLYFIEFCCAVIILGIFAYFLAALNSNGLHTDTYIRAVTGIAGAGVLFTLIAMLLVCCLGGVLLASMFAALLNLAFCGAFIYLAYATRHGASSCNGFVNTPLGNGQSANGNRIVGISGKGRISLPSFRTACKLNTACFAVAVVGAVFFFLSIFVEFMLLRHHRKEKRYGPSPNNGYTAGSPKRKFWQRKPKTTTTRDVEKVHPDTLPAHSTPHDVRHSYNTESTAVGAVPAVEPAYNKYAPPPATATHGTPYNNNTTHSALPATRGDGFANEAVRHPVSNSEYGQAGNFGERAQPDFIPRVVEAHHAVHGHQTTTTTHTPGANYSRQGNF